MDLETPVTVQERLGVLVMSSIFSQASGRGVELQCRHSEVSKCHSTGTFSGRTHHLPHSLVPSLVQGR